MRVLLAADFTVLADVFEVAVGVDRRDLVAFAAGPAAWGLAVPFLAAAKFAAADFVAADFAAADFVAADFVAADFVAADFVAADFVAADFVAADLATVRRRRGLVCSRSANSATAASSENVSGSAVFGSVAKMPSWLT
ncbi:MAG: pentapeptide repeat-containing protein [Stellaceae bacterium]